MGGVNNYQYAPNPTGWVDPFGLSCKEGDALPDGVVFAGHGSVEDGMFIMPEGASLTVYSELGATITDDLGVAIENGRIPSGLFSRTYESGDQTPNLRLFRPDNDVSVQPESFTVASTALVSDLIQSNMGKCQWAACTSNSSYPNSNQIYHTDGVYKEEGNKLYKETGNGWEVI